MLRFADAETKEGGMSISIDHEPSWPLDAKLSHALLKSDSAMR